ncbi:hypothetical protein ACJ5NV_00335 [Loktanella agnita]|uniref:hypothetical protein n=1 Tax=Loktanella agnita TaxID=287097 RepID=UPI003986B398
MRFILVLPALAALTACATPRESCLYQANNQLRSLEARMAETQGNIDRGYAIFESSETVTVERTCRDRLPDGTTRSYECDRTETVNRTDPVAVDVAYERQKLAEMETQLAALQAATLSAERQCIMMHPE